MRPWTGTRTYGVVTADVTVDHNGLVGSDLVHARFLLMHLRQRRDVLARRRRGWRRAAAWSSPIR